MTIIPYVFPNAHQRVTDSAIFCTTDSTLELSLGLPLFYIYVTDDDSGDNGRVSCTLNDTRLNLTYLTVNAYSLQISGSPVLDYETEQSIRVELKCTDFGSPTLSKTILFHFDLDDCNDNPPEFISNGALNQTISIAFENTKTPFILTQFRVDDRDRYQPKVFTYTLTVTPNLDLNLTNNGSLVLRSLPSAIGFYLVNVTVYDAGNLSSSVTIPIDIHFGNETIFFRTFNLDNTSLILVLSFFVIIFLASIFIGICFSIAFLLRKKKPGSHSPCSCCYSCFHRQTNFVRNSTCESMNSSTERADSSQKTTVEVLDDGRVRVYSFLIAFRLSLSPPLSIDTYR